MTTSGFHYLKGQRWSGVTREERVFCARLHELARDRLRDFVELVRTCDDRAQPRATPLEIDATATWELAYEAAVYRDVCHLLKPETEVYPDKRTFDLALFGANRLVIFEAKAQQGFKTKQLEEFRKDRKLVRKLLGVDVVIVGIWSSHYSPKPSTQANFDAALHWSTLAHFFGDDAPLHRADAIYRK